MKKDEILPVLDMEVLKTKANDAAMAGAIKSIEEYYTGYSSPFREKITSELQKGKIGSGIKLPDVIALINDSLSDEIHKIANASVAQSMVPMLQRFLVRADEEVKFSDILRQLIDSVYNVSLSDCSCEVTTSDHGWLNVELECEKNTYSITLHTYDPKEKKDDIQRYHMLSLPWDRSSHERCMKLTIDNAELKIPYTQNRLQDSFVSFLGTMLIADSKIVMDCEDFEEDMFGEECHCD